MQEAGALLAGLCAEAAPSSPPPALVQALLPCTGCDHLAQVQEKFASKAVGERRPSALLRTFQSTNHVSFHGVGVASIHVNVQYLAGPGLLPLAHVHRLLMFLFSHRS